MSVRLRLQRKGRKKRPFYRLVATDRSAPRDGRFIELLGTYDPMQEPPLLNFKRERIDHWLEHGATPSDTVKRLITFSGTESGTVPTKAKPSTLRRASEKANERTAAAKAKAEEAKAAETSAKEEPAAEEAPTEEASAEE